MDDTLRLEREGFMAKNYVEMNAMRVLTSKGRRLG